MDEMFTLISKIHQWTFMTFCSLVLYALVSCPHVLKQPYPRQYAVQIVLTFYIVASFVV